MRALSASETEIHKTCAQIVKLCVDPGEALIFHVPNGDYRHKATAAKLKAMGVMAGIADWCVIRPGGQVGFIELKSATGVANSAQKAVRRRCEGLKVPYEICRSSNEFIGVLRAWGVTVNSR